MRESAANVLPIIRKYAITAGAGGWLQALEKAKADRVSDDRVFDYMQKASVQGTGLESPLATDNVVRAWVESLGLDCATTQIPFVRVPLNASVSVSTLNATATLRNGGASTELTRLNLANSRLVPIMISMMLVLSQELARFQGAAAEALINAEERKGVGLVIDKTFFDTVVDGATPIRMSDGTDPANDIRQLLAYINQTGASRPYLVTDAETANDLAFWKSTNGGFLFPQVGVRGGSVQGIPLLISGGIVGRQIIGLDASSVAFNIDNVIIDQSTQASIQMDTSPTEDSLIPVATTAVSMFQTDSVASRVTVVLGIERLRSTAVAVVMNSYYGGAST